jgi:hypothetical protein
MAKVDSSNLHARLELLNSPEQLQKLGSTIVKNSIARTILSNTSGAKHAKGISIKQGEYIPVNLVELLHLEVDSKGLAIRDYQIFPNLFRADGGYDACTWIEVPSWGDSYCECWPDSGDMGLRPGIQVLARGVNKEELKSVFTQREIELLTNHHLLND